MRKLTTWFLAGCATFCVVTAAAETGDMGDPTRISFETARILNAALPAAAGHIPREFESEYSISIIEENDEVIVTFAAPFPDDGMVHRGSPSGRPGFSVHLERSTLKVVKTVFIR